MRTAQVPYDAPSPIETLKAQLGPGPFSMVCFFVSPAADFRHLTQRAIGQFGDADVLGCTTAGEIGADGYEDGQIIAVGFPRKWFSIDTHVIENLDTLDGKSTIDRLIQSRVSLLQRVPHFPHEFALMLIDGLSLQEERLTALLASGLGPMPLFGGSSGDGTDFVQTLLARNGVVYENAAVVAMVRSACPVKVFSLDHFQPTETRMVVTSADPAQRIVREINAEPAAAEYARLLGKDPEQLSPFTFAAHPVLVRLGDTHHVRSIQSMSETGELRFFSAINEGMVLSLAEHLDIVQHLSDGLSRLTISDEPDLVLGCDCLFRRIAAEQAQQSRGMSNVLTQHNVIGFSTYGEQIGSLHVNQTFTGVAIYPPPQQ